VLNLPTDWQVYFSIKTEPYLNIAGNLKIKILKEYYGVRNHKKNGALLKCEMSKNN
jgi:hypothetical protein